MRFTGGIQICWGKSTNGDVLSKPASRVYYMKPFTNIPAVVATCIAEAYFVSISENYNTPNTYLDLCHYFYNGTMNYSPNPDTAFYIAIGHWE